MAAVIGGEGLGVYNGTLTQLNGFGADGRSRVGFGRDNAFVNAANGNLVLRGQDEFVASQGPDLEFFRTYNSQGPSIDRNGDNWQQSYARRIARSDDGSSLVRITGDGHQTLFSQVGSNNEWVSTDGAGAHDRIELQEDGSFTVEFGGTGLVETYSSNGRLLSIANADGHTVTLGYDITPPLISPLIEAGGGGGLLGGLLGGVVELVLDLVGAVLNLPLVSDLTGGVLGDLNPIEGASRLTTITDSNGQEIRLTYDGITEQLTQVSTFQYAAGADAESDQKVEVSRVSYEYEAYNADGLPGNEAQRLKTVGVALDPASSNSTNYATTYYYYPDSNRIGGAVQSDGSGFGISYIQVAGEYRVATFSDALGNVSHFSYALTPASYTVEGQVLSNVTRTTVMDPRKVKTHYYFDADQQLLAVETLAGPDHSQVQFFEYDDDGNVTAVTDEAGRRTEHLYDDQGNVIRSRDELGNTLVRGYDPSTQRLISETTYTDRDPDGIGQSGEPSEAQTRHFVYDDEQHLRFVIEADGGVTEHRYAPDGSAKDGQRTTTIAYVGIAYGGVTFGESALDAWVSGLPAAERAASQRTDFAYDPTGQLANVTRYAAVDGSTGDGINDGDASQTHYVYDAQGRLLMQVDPRRVAGDDGLTPVDRTDYASLSAAPDNLPSHVSLYVYNNLDLLTASTDAQGRTTQTSYSFAGPSGTTVTSTNAQGLETTTVYSRAGELLSQTLSGDGVQETTSYTYDAASNRLSQTNELGATQRFAYDASGNLVAQSSAEGELQLFDYNDAGNVIRKHERSDSLIHDVNLSDGEGFRPGSSFVGQDQVADRLFVDNDQLVIRNRSKSGSGSIFPSLIAQQEYSYQEGLVFRSEITTEGSNAERSAFIFVSNTDVIPGETDQVRRHGVQFRPNGELWANYFDPPTNNYKSVSIGTYQSDTTYVMEVELQETGSVVRVYEKGQNPATAMTHTTNITDWGKARWQFFSQGWSAAQGVTDTYVDNLETYLLAPGQTVPAQNSSDVRTSHQLYDDAGQLTASIDAEGYVTEYRYDGTGQLIEEFAYVNPTAAVPESGRMAEFTLPAEDAAGQDRRMRYFYDETGRSLGSLDAGSFLTENVYDAAGRLIEQIAYANRITSAQRWIDDFATLKTSVPVDAENDRHSHQFYDGQGRLIGSLDAEGYLTRYGYDRAGNQTQRTHHFDPVSYDGSQTLETLTNDATNLAKDQITGFIYDGVNRLVSSTDSSGTVSRNFYDEDSGFLIRTEVGEHSSGDLSQRRIGLAEYDDLGRVTRSLSGRGAQEIEEGADVATTWAAYADTHSYDALGRRRETIEASGRTVRYFYDKDDRLRYTVTSGAQGVSSQLGEVSEVRYNDFGEIEVTVEYAERVDMDTLGAGTSVDDVNGLLNENDEANRLVGHSHTDRGQLAQITDAEDFQTSYNYNSFGERVQQHSDTGRTPGERITTTELTYNKRGLVTQTTEALGTALERSSKVLQYDAFRRAEITQDARGIIHKVDYDRRGQVISTIQDDGGLNITRTSEYDAVGRIVSQIDANGHATTYQYVDSNAQDLPELIVTTPEGITTKTIFNRHGQDFEVYDGENKLSRFSYDKDGNLTHSTDPLNITTQRVYDEGGLLIRLEEGQENSAQGLQITRFAYDENKRVLSRIVDTADGPLTTTFEYNAFGEVVNSTDPRGVVTTTQFNERGEEVAVIVDSTASAEHGGDHISNETPLRLATVYTHDAQGHRVTVSEGIEAVELNGEFDLSTNAALRVSDYTFDEQGRREQEVMAPGDLDITTQYQYDANDNLIRRIDAEGYHWLYVHDAANRQIFEIDPEGGVSERVLDNEGRLAQTIRYGVAIDVGTLGSNPDEIEIRAAIQAAEDAAQNPAVDDGFGFWSQDFSDGTSGLDIQGNAARFQHDPIGQHWVLHSENYSSLFDRNAVYGERHFDVADDALTTRAELKVVDKGSYEVGVVNDANLIGQSGLVQQHALFLHLGSTGSLSLYIVNETNGTPSYQYAGAGTVGTNYVVETEVENGQSTLYIYEFGQTRSDGYSRTFSHAAWTGAQSYLAANDSNYTNAGPGTAHVDNLTEVQGSPVRWDQDFGTDLDGIIITEKPERFEYDGNGERLILRSENGTGVAEQYGAYGARSYTLDSEPLLVRGEIELPNTGVYSFGVANDADLRGETGFLQQYAFVYSSGSYRYLYLVNETNGTPSYSYVGIAEQGATYVYEAEVVDGQSTIYLYKQGETRADGSSRIFANAGWTEAQLFVAANDSSVTTTPSYAYLDNLSEQKGEVVVPAEPPENRQSYYARDNNGRVELEAHRVSRDTYLLTGYIYDANSRIIETKKYATAYVGDPQALIDRTATPSVDSQNDQVTHSVYDDAGRERFRIDALNYVTVLNYDAVGQLIEQTRLATAISDSVDFTQFSEVYASVEDVNGLRDSAQDRATHFAYDAAGRLRYTSRLLLQDGQLKAFVTEHFYNASGHQTGERQFAAASNLSGFEDLSGVTTVAGLVQSLESDPDNRQTSQTYDGAGRVATSTDAEGASESYKYDALGNRKELTNALGNTWTYDYDAAGRLSQETSPVVSLAPAGEEVLAPVIKRFSYDALGNLSQLVEGTDVQGVYSQLRTIDYTFDGTGRQQIIQYPETTVHAENVAPLSSDYTELASSFSKTYFDAQGHAYANLNRAGDFSYKLYDGLGRVAYEIDEERYVTQNRYDAFGNIIELIRYETALSDSAWRELENSARSDEGNAQGALAANNRAAAADHWVAAEQAVRTIESVLRAAVADLDSALGRTLQTDYDSRNQAIEQRQPEVDFFEAAGNFSGKAQPISQLAYNAFGEAEVSIEYSEPTRQLSNFTVYDQLGRKQREQDHGGFVTGYDYGETPFGVEKRTEYAKQQNFSTFEAFSAQDVHIESTAPSGLDVSSTGYDRVTQYEYDRIDRVLSESRLQVEYSEDGSAQNVVGDLHKSYEYDVLGNLVLETDELGQKTRTFYDELGRVSAIATEQRPIEDSGFRAAAEVFGFQAKVTQRGFLSFSHNGDSWEPTFNGNNVVTFNWSSLRGLIGGEIRVSITYDGNQQQSYVYDKGNVELGAVLKWSNASQAISNLNSATVEWRQSSAQSWQTIFGQSGGTDDVLEKHDRIAFTNVPGNVSQLDLILESDGIARSMTRIGSGTLWVIDEVQIPVGNSEFRLSAKNSSGGPVSLDIVGGNSNGELLGRIGYDSGNRVIELRGREQSIIPLTTFGYDALGNTTTTLNYAQGAANNPFIDNNFVVAAQDSYSVADAAHDQRTVNEYNVLGQLTHTIAPDGGESWNEYYKSGLLARKRLELDSPISYLGSREAQTIYEYDRTGRETASIDVVARFDNTDVRVHTRTSVYNGYGELIARGLGADGTAPMDIELYRYDAAGRLTEETNAHGQRWLYRRDLRGSVNQAMQLKYFTQVSDPANISVFDSRRTSFERDEMGRTILETQPSFTNESPDFIKERARLNADKTVNVPIFVGRGSVLFRYQPTTGGSWSYAALDQIEDGLYQITSALQDGTFSFEIVVISESFDPEEFYPQSLRQNGTFAGTMQVSSGNIIAQSLQNNGPSDVPYDTTEQTPQIARTYDRWGNVRSLTDAAGNQTSYIYDYANRQIQVTYPQNISRYGDDGQQDAGLGQIQRYYDQLGREVAIVDGNGIVRYRAYDVDGRVVQETQPDASHQQTYRYDALGNQVLSIDGAGGVTRREFNLSGQVVFQEVVGTNSTKSFTYDHAGRRLSVTNGELEITRNLYDTVGNLVRVLTPLAGFGTNSNYAKRMEYDAQGNKISESQVTETGSVEEQLWSYDLYGRLRTETGKDGEVTERTYSQFGDLTRIKRDIASAYTIDPRERSILFRYLDDGKLSQVSDLYENKEQWYAYDIRGSVVRDAFADSDGIHRDAFYHYDELQRLTEVGDQRYTGEYLYDGSGNRRALRVEYFDKNGARQEQEYWYTYDGMDRMTISRGVLNTNTNEIEIRRQPEISDPEGQGIEISYDAAGRRSSTFGYQYSLSEREIQETYRYDAAGRLITDTHSERYKQWTSGPPRPGSGGQPVPFQIGVERARTYFRSYDGADRVTQYNIGTSRQELEYDFNGRLERQADSVQDGSSYRLQSEIIYGDPNGATFVDRVGYDYQDNPLYYQLKVYDDNGDLHYRNDYSYNYEVADTRRLDSIDAFNVQGVGNLPGNFEDGQTDYIYDRNDATVQILDVNGDVARRDLRTDINGNIVSKRNYDESLESLGDQYYVYNADRQQIATYGALNDADFDMNYTPVSSQFPAGSPSTYVVNNSGEDLRTVSYAVYGDAELWYLIADANGKTSPGDLRVGESLTIPNRISNLRNAADTFKPVSFGEIVGSTTPTLDYIPPPPPSDASCGVLAQIIVVVVAVIVTIYTAGAAAGAIGAATSAGAGAAGAGTFATGAAVLGGAGATVGVSTGVAVASAGIGAAVGSIVSQGVGIALGVQKGFDFGQVATSALSASFLSFTGGGQLFGKPGTAGGLAQYGKQAANAIGSNIVQQSFNIALDQQDSFSWSNVAASVVTSFVPQAEQSSAGADGFVQELGGRTLRGVTQQGVTILLEGDGRIDFANIAADAFGNAIGNSIVGHIAGRNQQVNQEPEQDTGRVNADALGRAFEEGGGIGLRTSDDLILAPELDALSEGFARSGSQIDAQLAEIRAAEEARPIEQAAVSAGASLTSEQSEALREAAALNDGQRRSRQPTPGLELPPGTVTQRIARTSQSVDAQRANLIADAQQQLGGAFGLSNGYTGNSLTLGQVIGDAFDQANDFTRIQALVDAKAAGSSALNGLADGIIDGSGGNLSLIDHAGLGGIALGNAVLELFAPESGIDLALTSTGLAALGKLSSIGGSTTQIANLRRLDTSKVNAEFTSRGLNAPFNQGVDVREFEAASELNFVRVHNQNNPRGGWMVRAEEIEGMAPIEIQQHLALPEIPTHIQNISVPAGHTLRAGRVGPQPQWGAPNPAATQYHSPSFLPNSAFGESLELAQ